MDTPGLSDVEMRKKAAEAIDSALKKGGLFKIFFVVTTESGRIRPDDLTTIQLVCEAIGEPFKWGLIVNKLSANAIKKFNDEFVKFSAGFAKFPFSSHYFLKNIAEMEDENNALAKLPDEFLKFIGEFPFFNLNKEKLKDINYESFSELKEKYEKQLKHLSENLEFQKQESEKFKKQLEQIKIESAKKEKQYLAMIEKDRKNILKLQNENEQRNKEISHLQNEQQAYQKKLQDVQNNAAKQLEKVNRQHQKDLEEMRSDLEDRFDRQTAVIERQYMAKEEEMNRRINQIRNEQERNSQLRESESIRETNRFAAQSSPTYISESNSNNSFESLDFSGRSNYEYPSMISSESSSSAYGKGSAKQASSSESNQSNSIGKYVSNGRANGREVYQGSRGGKYYFTDSGNKAYVKDDQVDFN
jgi:hypothetical protein